MRDPDQFDQITEELLDFLKDECARDIRKCFPWDDAELRVALEEIAEARREQIAEEGDN
jgi:hypothetical protein